MAPEVSDEQENARLHRLLDEENRQLAEIEYHRIEAARKEHERQQQAAGLEQRAKEAAEAEEFRQKLLEHRRQLKEWNADPVQYAIDQRLI